MKEELYLTCPVCCGDALRKVERNIWKCLDCQSSFDFDRLRERLADLVGQEFTEDFIDELLGKTKFERCPRLGERGWKWRGKFGVLYTLDVGNGWHFIVRVNRGVSKEARSHL
ncbi:MAG: hypothetical protein QXR87_04380 [Candidatus Hadarchaeales archaeon]